MPPSQIIFIRHAEKSNIGPDLNVVGLLHAQAWSFFFTTEKPNTINIPQVLYAMKDSNSNRSFETLEPLSLVLNTNINIIYTHLISLLLSNENNGKIVLVCWEYKTIPTIINNILKTLSFSDEKVVKNWGKNPLDNKSDNSDFSTIWLLQFQKNNSSFLTVYPGCSINNDNTVNFNRTSNMIDSYTIKLT